MGNMVQYGVWSNCCNQCAFCCRKDRIPHPREKQLNTLELIKKNIPLVDWKDKFSYGISLLGGELYYITDEEMQKSFLELIDIIIEKILKVSPNPYCKYSTVTNGMYNPAFLFQCIDKIKNAVGMDHVDVNFSYDLKYRFKNQETANLVLENINKFHDRYTYSVGVQMIMTQYVINSWKEGKFDVNKFMEEKIPGNFLTFLYPHKIQTGRQLPDFNFNRKDFLMFLRYLKNECQNQYMSFLYSTKNSAIFKYTGLKDKVTADEVPLLTDDKEVMNTKCGHSILYQCYSDCDKCMLCDLTNLEKGIIG